MRKHYLEVPVKVALGVIGVVQARVEGLISPPELGHLFPECKTGLRPVLTFDMKVFR